MAKGSYGVGQPDPGVGTPPTRSSDILLTEVAKLQSDYTHLQNDLKDTRGDMKDVRDRLTALEVEVKHLPGKGFIITVVTVALGIAVGLLAIAPRIQAFVNPPPAATAPAPQPNTTQANP